MTGGPGTDRFRFETGLRASDNRDRIVDFEIGTDEIELNDALFGGLAEGPLADRNFRIGAAQDGNDRILYNGQNGTLSYDPDGDGAQAAIAFARLDPHLPLTADDFRAV